MKLNCDLGESYGAWQMGNDAQIMPLIDQANIACGFHAGDPLIIQHTIILAVTHNVSIGAHPSYPDIQGFGRRSMALSEQELIACFHFQLSALAGMCQVQGATLDYVKPHGALYNDMMREKAIFQTLCKALSQFNDQLPLVIQAIPNNELFIAIAQQYGITLRFEAFADRNYQDNGLLVPRTESNAVLTDPDQISQRVKQLSSTGNLLSINGKPLTLQVDTLCVHGDTNNAIEIVKKLAES
ncbi:5-oxoprolinase subunit PxpA [Thalassotalea sp. M1531]|uniref:5-oxoprolinase subunit PxpA n=1 Tax=Thalassotalea algicola TaxID=2716224 RepID=A0A7Y0LCN7_9GAMM|nr:5-oxoprolinase subunit PxpA [Thalassotalea algicola]NMP31677.1 5-oxoprolinase subunit PxpA [Thalassotalea algicola]